MTQVVSPNSQQQITENSQEANNEEYGYLGKTLIGLGCLAGGLIAAKVTNYALDRFVYSDNLDFSKPQNAASYLEQIFTYGDSWTKAEAVYQIAFLAPVMEEFAFRGYFHDLLVSWSSDPNSTMNKVIRTVVNAFFFAAAHLSVHQGATNIPIFISLFFLGAAFSAAREITGGVYAPTIAHIVNNALAIYSVYKDIHQTAGKILLMAPMMVISQARNLI